MLTWDCGMLGIQTDAYSHIYFPTRSLRWLPSATIRRAYSFDHSVSIHVSSAEANLDSDLYRIFFRFRFTQITKVHLSKWVDEASLPCEQKAFQLPIVEVTFP